MEEQQVVVGAHVPVSIADRIRKQARVENRSVSNLVRVVLLDYLARKES